MVATGVREEIDRLLGTVDDVMERAVLTLRADQPIGEAARELERRGVSGAPVVNGQGVLGMVSLADLFGAIGVSPDRAATTGPWHRYEHDLVESDATVGDVMTSAAVTLPIGTPIPEAARVMRERGVNRVPIVDAAGVVKGIVAREDVIEAVARAASTLHRPMFRPGAVARRW